MYITKLLLVTLGIAAVVTLALQPTAPRVPGWRLFASVLPLSLIAGAVLAVLPSEA